MPNRAFLSLARPPATVDGRENFNYISRKARDAEKDTQNRGQMTQIHENDKNQHGERARRKILKSLIDFDQTEIEIFGRSPSTLSPLVFPSNLDEITSVE
jgi:hypothetical protein